MFDFLKYFNTSDLLLQFNRKSYNIQPTIWWWIIDYHWLSWSFYSTPAAALVIKTLPVKHDFVLTAVFRFLPEAAACPVLHVSCPQAKRYPPLFSGHLCKRDGIRFSKPFKIVRDIFKSKLKIRPKSRGQTVNNSAKPEAETSWLNQHHYRNIFTSITKSSIRASGAKRGRGLRSPAHRYLSKCAEAGLVLHTQPFIFCGSCSPQDEPLCSDTVKRRFQSWPRSRNYLCVFLLFLEVARDVLWRDLTAGGERLCDSLDSRQRRWGGGMLTAAAR